MDDGFLAAVRGDQVRQQLLWQGLVLDYVIMGAVVIAVIFAIITGSGEATGEVVLAGFITFYLICPLMESSPWQATIGKKMMKLQITDADGRRIGFWRAFFRNMLRSVVFYLYFVTLGIPLIVQYFRFKKTKKLFHDEVSSTVIGERLLRATPAGHAVAAA